LEGKRWSEVQNVFVTLKAVVLFALI
jgi:hypothetical protein